MTEALGQAALLVTVLGMLAAVGVTVRLRRLQPAIAVLSDFLLAAGLIRLAGHLTWTSLALASATAAVRLVLNANLRKLHSRHVRGRTL
ncbi:hypothetical protein OHU34_38370 [Streptomyces sp. NBC_00080]|uniref:hypothetical protein n=1 Tax=Streptomyces sp. NBC_00080 TaxID=2975645 RepID=UPI0032473169